MFAVGSHLGNIDKGKLDDEISPPGPLHYDRSVGRSVFVRDPRSSEGRILKLYVELAMNRLDGCETIYFGDELAGVGFDKRSKKLRHRDLLMRTASTNQQQS